MEVTTTEPGVQLYTANGMKNIKGRSGKVYNDHAAFCLETQHFPDSPNKLHFPSTVLRPGQKFQSTTIFKFSTRQE
jgi:aldose 1-epimerase